MDKKVPLKKWHLVDKACFSSAIAFMVFCALLSVADYKTNRKKWAAVQAGCCAINALSASKIMHNARKRVR